MRSADSKIWRESASLILAARSVFSSPQDKFNYKILCMKRSAESKFMPSTYVFPGGLLSKSDLNLEWLNLYKNFGISAEDFAKNSRAEENVPDILKEKGGNLLPRELAFRICAIRETFEECGVLLCRSPKINTGKGSNWASFVGGSDVSKWRPRVQENPEEFINLCSQLEIYPDIWSLKIWSNWLTPPCKSLRFNAIFFLATINQLPPTSSDGKEVADVMWTTPDQCIADNKDERIMLPPPQMYENSRLRNVHDIDKLSTFAEERSKFGCEPYWPCRIKTDEGHYLILPGDDLYPGSIDSTKTDIPYESKLPDSTVQNRILHECEYFGKLITRNFKPGCGHIAPSTD